LARFRQARKKELSEVKKDMHIPGIGSGGGEVLWVAEMAVDTMGDRSM